MSLAHNQTVGILVGADITSPTVAASQLTTIQRQFAHALWHPKDLLAVPAPALVRGMGIYQNNTRLTLLRVVTATYPVMAQVLGDVFFMALARSYVISTPSLSGYLQPYPHAFSPWLRRWLDALEDREEAAALGYLPDLALLEGLISNATDAPDAQPFDFAALQAVNPSEHGTLCFKLHPSVGLLQSQFPVAQIWRAHNALAASQFVTDAELSEAAVSTINWDCVPEQAMVWRQSVSQFEIAVKIRECSAGEFQFLTDLAAGEDFMQATNKALDVDAELDLQALLFGLVQEGVIVGFTLPAANCA